MTPNMIDLTTVDRVKSWLKITSPVDDDKLQDCITAASRYWLWRTGRGSTDGAPPAASPFVQPVQFDEAYDGPGGMRMFLRNWPIISVAAVTLDGIAVTASPNQTTPGYVIDASKRSLSLRLGVGYMPGHGAPFSALNRTQRAGGFGGHDPNYNIQNVRVQYMAGYQARAITDELATIPVAAAWVSNHAYNLGDLVDDGTNIEKCVTPGTSETPGPPAWNATIGGYTPDGQVVWQNVGVAGTGAFIVTVSVLPWISDVGVKYFSGGSPLTKVTSAPSTGEYYLLGGGSYLFALGDEGVPVQISYTATGTPDDVELACRQMVSVNYRRRQWIDQKSQSMAQGAGTISYRDWELPPEVVSVMDAYSRRALV